MWFSATKVSPMLPSKSKHQIPSVMPIVSCDVKTTTLTFTHKTVKVMEKQTKKSHDRKFSYLLMMVMDKNMSYQNFC